MILIAKTLQIQCMHHVTKLFDHYFAHGNL